MKRLTSNDVWAMDMHSLALNQVYIGQDGWAQYREYPEHERSVCDLIRAAAETLAVELPMLSDEDLSDLMLDCLQYGEEEPEGVLAILYRALCAMAEIRAQLSRYEDTGLEPSQIMAVMEPPPNTPLTLKELRKMDGEPVYLSWGGTYGEWTLVRISQGSEAAVSLRLMNGILVPANFALECGGKIYSRKPEG